MRTHKRGKTPGKLALADVTVAKPLQKDVPQWVDMNGDMHLDEHDCMEANIRFVVDMIVERDYSLRDDQEDCVDFILRNRQLLMTALSGNVDARAAFELFMRDKFGKDWKVRMQDDNSKALVAGMREAFIAGGNA
jgi:hypothetical protein